MSTIAENGPPDVTPEHASRFQRLGVFVARRRWWVVAAWAVILLAALPLAPQAGSALRAGGFTLPDLPASQAQATLAELGQPPSALVVVVESQTAGRAGEPAFERAVAAALRDVPAAPHVVALQTHQLQPRQVSPDGRVVYEVVFLDLAPDDSPEAVAPVEAALHPEPGLRLLLGGGPAFYGDIQAVSESDLRRAELVSLPLAALALLLVFGTVVAAGVPLVVGGSAVLVALAAIFLLAGVTPMSIFVLNLATLLGLGLGVDYSLLLTSRFREELARRGGGRRPDGSVDREAVDQAVALTVATAGRAVFFSGLTVLLGLIGLVLFDFMVLRSVGLAGAIVVGLAVAAALTLLPAVLAILGPRLEALAVRRRSTGDPVAEGQGRWARLAWWVMRRPWRVFLPTLACLVLLGLPFLHVRFNAPDATILPTQVGSREAYELLAANFGEGEFAPLVLAIRTSGPVSDPATIGALYDYSRQLAADPRVRRVDGIVDLDARLTRTQYQLLYGAPGGPPDRLAAAALAATTRGDLTAFTVITPYGPNAQAARDLVTALRDPTSPLAPPAGLSVQVAGGAAEVKDVVERMSQDFPRTAAFIFLTTYLVLFVLLRSVVLPLKALAMNSLSILASFGALVWIFQDGNLSALLGFQPLGFVETSQPVILFCVLFGLSMDYEVFLLSRMKEVYDRTGDNQLAVARGLARSGRIVTSAALIVVIVAGSFAFSEIVLIKALGLGMAIAVALDATVVRALLVPATMRLLGDWNWWLPKRLERLVTSRLPVVEGATLVQVALLGLLAVLLFAACSPGGALLANPPVVRHSPAATAAPPSTAPDPQPVRLPADEAPHDRLTEWWYYTGHLQTADGSRYGFEFVIFRAQRGAFPVSWASHVAVTDEGAGAFHYAQRTEIGPQVDASTIVSSGPNGFVLAISGAEAAAGGGSASPWAMRGYEGHDHLAVSLSPGEAAAAGSAGGLGFQLDLAATKPPTLHDGDGWVDFGPAGGSYYYSRMRLGATGQLTVAGRTADVSGEAWFDHQWGDFIAVGGGGWDWYAVNLADGTDLTISLVRDRAGSYPLVYGTLVAADGRVRKLQRGDFTVTTTGSWTSPHTGAIYPAGWRIEIPSEDLVVSLTPAVDDQELDTRASTGVVYWEGSQRVAATRAGQALGGEAYVELTGYGPVSSPTASPPPAP
ncbi:MAG: MMPL family transporter [Candidatus Limnocylindrales bacterium]